MAISDVVHTFGQWLLEKHGERVHKIALNAGFSCPNRDGSKGMGGCTFCNNASFSPNARNVIALETQLADGRQVISRRNGAGKFLAYFQAYTNTYGEVQRLKSLYDRALSCEGVIGLAVGTRPDCVPDEVLDLLAEYREQGHEVVLELGLQSAFDATLARVNRGHGLKEYATACRAARRRGIPVCTHLILGLPGEEAWHYHSTLDIVLDIGTEGLKLHPLHVVRGTALANEWRRGEYAPMALDDYVEAAADLIERTPWDVVYHRVTGTAGPKLLLAPDWCVGKWPAINGIEQALKRRGSRQGAKLDGGDGDVRAA
ncbi:MAG: TIGR01212 family radical SAM protein [Betaproteobacteria bacterium]|nr:TIGR01212 family radical SAM protein [Betaproteobacteria bacterium]